MSCARRAGCYGVAKSDPDPSSGISCVGPIDGQRGEIAVSMSTDGLGKFVRAAVVSGLLGAAGLVAVAGPAHAQDVDRRRHRRCDRRRDRRLRPTAAPTAPRRHDRHQRRLGQRRPARSRVARLARRWRSVAPRWASPSPAVASSPPGRSPLGWIARQARGRKAPGFFASRVRVASPRSGGRRRPWRLLATCSSRRRRRGHDLLRITSRPRGRT